MTSDPPTTAGWDRECVKCATKWVERHGGVNCPGCEQIAESERQAINDACDEEYWRYIHHDD